MPVLYETKSPILTPPAPMMLHQKGTGYILQWREESHMFPQGKGNNIEGLRSDVGVGQEGHWLRTSGPPSQPDL